MTMMIAWNCCQDSRQECFLSVHQWPSYVYQTSTMTRGPQRLQIEPHIKSSLVPRLSPTRRRQPVKQRNKRHGYIER